MIYPVLRPDLKPSQSSYGFNYNSGLIVTDLAGGPPRVRRGYANSYTELAVTWQCTAIQYDYMQAFYRDGMREGLQPFWMCLMAEATSLMPHLCYLKPDTFGLASVAGGTYMVQATIMFRPYRASDMLAYSEAVRNAIETNGDWIDVSPEIRALLPAACGDIVQCMPASIRLAGAPYADIYYASIVVRSSVGTAAVGRTASTLFEALLQMITAVSAELPPAAWILASTASDATDIKINFYRPTGWDVVPIEVSFALGTTGGVAADLTQVSVPANDTFRKEISGVFTEQINHLFTLDDGRFCGLNQ